MKINIQVLFLLLIVVCNSCETGASEENKSARSVATLAVQKPLPKSFDTSDYNKKMLAISNRDKNGLWPAKAPYPLAGAIFPYSRVVAFYGNLYSKRMGILGQ